VNRVITGTATLWVRRVDPGVLIGAITLQVPSFERITGLEEAEDGEQAVIRTVALIIGTRNSEDRH
jgi:hypothetical protein